MTRLSAAIFIWAALLALVGLPARAQDAATETVDAASEAARLLTKVRELLDAKKPNLAQARTLAAEAAKLAPDNLDARFLYGVLARRTGQYKTARRELELVRQKAPDRPGVARPLAEALEALKETRRAAPLFLAASAEEKNPELALKAGRYAFAAGDLKTACDGFNAAGPLKGEDLEKYASAAEQAQRFAEARDAYEKLAAAAADPTPWQLGLTRVLLATKDQAGAQQVLEAVLAKKPENGDALLGMADLARARGDATSEEEWARKAAKLQPPHPIASRRLGQVLLARGDLPGAKQAFLTQLTVNAKDAVAHLELAKIALAEKDAPAAAESARQALTHGNPKDRSANLLLGRALKAMKDCAAAVGPLRLAARGSDDPDAQLDLAECLVATDAENQAMEIVRAVQEKDKANPRSHEVAGTVALRRGQKKLAAEEFRIALGGYPNDPDYTVKVARAYLDASDVPGAETLLEKALALKPDHPEASRERARLYVQAGAFDKALPLLETALRAHPDDVDVLVALGQAHRAAAARKLGPSLDAADQAVEKALALRPNGPEANELAGLLAIDRAAAGGDPAALEAARKAALPRLEAALKGQPGHEALAILASERRAARDVAGAKALLARVREVPRPGDVVTVEAALELDAGNPAAAEKKLIAYLGTEPDDPVAFSTGGDIAFALGNLKDARARYEKARAKLPLTPTQQARYSAALVAEGQYAQARDEARAAILKGFDEGSVHATLAQAYFKLGDRISAKAEVETALAKGASSVATRLILGEIALDEGDEEKALEQYNAALTLDKKNPFANGAAGRILAGRRKYQEAIPKLRIAWEALPGDAKVAAALAKSYLAVGGLTTEAEEILNTLPEGALEAATLATLRGVIASQRGNFVKAAKEFDKAVAARPGDPEILQLQADNFLRMPQYEKAIAALEQATEKAPDRTDLVQKLARLYAEIGQREKAAQASARAEAALQAEREEARKKLSPDQIKVVAVAETFRNTSPEPQGGASYGYLSITLSQGVAAALSKIPSIQILERNEKTLQEIEKQKEAWAAEHPDATPEEVGAAMGRFRMTAPYVVDGQFMVVPGARGVAPQLQLSARLVEVKGQKVVRSASRNAPLEDFARLANAVALELVGEFVPLTEKEREQIENALPAGNLESMRLLAEAEEARRRGDLRGAAALLKKARAADEGNLAALEALERTRKELGVKNRVAVRDFVRIGDAPAYIEAGLQASITAKLANIEGIQVVERDQMPAVEKELELWAQENADALETGTEEEKAVLLAEAEKLKRSLPVGALVTGDYQMERGRLLINAKLTDLETRTTLLAEQVSGQESQILDLQNQLAERIARRLVGAPSEEEMQRLREKKDFESYKLDMEELARRREEEKRRQEEEAAAKLAQAGLSKSDPSEPGPDKAQAPPREPEAREGFWTKARWMALASSHPVGLDLSLVHLQHAHLEGLANVRTSWIVGVASNRWSTSRAYDYAPVALYDTGLDVDVDFGYGGFALAAGGALTVGMAQTLVGQQVQNSLFLGVRPRVGAVLNLWGLRLSGDVGVQLARTGLGESEGGLNGLFFQAGATFLYDGVPALPGGLELGYRAHLLVPNGARVHQKYGGLFGADGEGGVVPVHQVVIGSTERGESGRSALVVSYLARSSASGGEELSLLDAGWDYEYRLYADRRSFNPFLATRLAIGGLKAPELASECADTCLALTGAARVGLLTTVLGFLDIQAAFGYEAIFSRLEEAADPSGYTLDAGASVRF